MNEPTILSDLLGQNVLTLLVFLPAVGGLTVLALPGEAKNAVRALGLLFSGAAFAVSAWIASGFDPAAPGISGFRFDVPWVPRLGIFYRVGIDGLSLSLVLLTTFLTVCVLLVACGQKIDRWKGYVAAFLFLCLLYTSDAADE